MTSQLQDATVEAPVEHSTENGLHKNAHAFGLSPEECPPRFEDVQMLAVASSR